MRWLQLEYMAKGIFLGLLVYVAFQQPEKGHIELLVLSMVGGLAAGLAVAALNTLRQGYRIKGRSVAFVLFLILENPTATYLGILAGIGMAAFAVPKKVTEPWLLPACTLGGGLLGLGFPLVCLLRHWWLRFLSGLALAMAPVGAIIGWLYLDPYQTFLGNREAAGLLILLGLPFFYLLAFGGRVEETEVEIAALCSLLCLALWLLQPFTFRTLAFAVPALLYWVYTTRYLPRMSVFKNTMRGLSYAGAGRHVQALRTFRRALEIDPDARMAREGLWSVHRSLDLAKASQDPELLSLVDPKLCLQRAGSLLIDARPTSEQLEEAHHLLDFVHEQRPEHRPLVQYWRSVAHLKSGEVEKATEELAGILDPSKWPAGDPHRAGVLLQAWELALLLHPQMQQRVGGPQLAIPGRRMEAIAAVERRLAEDPSSKPAWDLKRLLYANLTEEEYVQGIGPQPAEASATAAPHFDYSYVQQLGLALLQDPARWQRGAEMLRIAARGMPMHGPSIFVQIAQGAAKAGDSEASLHYYRQAQQAGRTIGPKNLSEEEKQAYFSAVKLLGETAQSRGDLEAAIESYTLYLDNDRSGIDTLRTLAELYEKKAARDNDQVAILNALRATELALYYNSSDKDLLERKDRYYYDVQPETLSGRRESVSKYFDVAYCLKKARTILDSKNSDLDMIDWALHLARAARAVQPGSVTAMLCEARALLRKNQRQEALVILEDIRELNLEKFADGDDQDSWYVANRLLGDMYLNELSRPDLAVHCFQEFKKSTRSGADTLYKLGQAYEGCGDLKRAASYYNQVVAYEDHPLVYDARQALYRVQSQSSGERSDTTA